MIVIYANHIKCSQLVQMSKVIKKTPYGGRPVPQMSGLPSHLSYIFICPNLNLDLTPDGVSVSQSFALPFPDEGVTVEKLIAKLKADVPQLQKLGEVTLADMRNYVYDKSWTMKEVKNHLRVDNINGTEFYLTTKTGNQQKSSLLNECAVPQYAINYQQQRSSACIQLHFELDSSDTVITTDCSFESEDHGHTILLDFVKELNSIYGTNVRAEDISYLKAKDTGILITNETNIWQTRGLGNRSKIQVIFKDASFKLPKIKAERYNQLVIYDIDGVLTKTLNYEQIKHMTFESIYYRYFGKTAISKQNLISLRIANTIIPPSDKLNCLDYIYLINHKKMYGTVNLVGKVITEKVAFFLTLDQTLKEEGSFKIDQNCLRGEDIQNHRNRIEKCALDQTLHAPDSYFGKKENVELIYYYSAQLQYDPGNIQESTSLFSTVNRTVENQSIIYKSPQEIKESWIYQYLHSFLNHLRMIPTEELQVYRGINYDLQREPGETVSFKSLLSTSRNQNIALNFAIQSYDKKTVMVQQLKKRLGENYQQHLHREQIKYVCSQNKYVLLTLKTKKGRSIQRFSCFPFEEEVLLEPYTTFKVTKKWIDSELLIGFDFLRYELVEVQEPSDFDQGKTSYICWVDDKKEEGAKFQKSIVNRYLESTIFLQLQNTVELFDWINGNKKFLESPESNVVFISNMTRFESGKLNELAGVETIKLIRSLLKKEVPICLYIGNRPKALQKLKDSSILLKQNCLQVFDQTKELTDFIRRFVKVVYTFDVDEPSVTNLHHTPFNSNQNELFQTPITQVQKQCKCIIM